MEKNNLPMKILCEGIPIKQNADRMLDLIKQLLELSRLETISVPVKSKKENFSPLSNLENSY